MNYALRQFVLGCGLEKRFNFMYRSCRFARALMTPSNALTLAYVKNQIHVDGIRSLFEV